MLILHRGTALSIGRQVLYTWVGRTNGRTGKAPRMSDKTDPGSAAGPANAGNGNAPVETIPEDLALEIRRLAHDLSNALEIIVQTSFLLSTAGLKEPASDWLGMLDSGVNKALGINQDLRAYIKTHAAR
jgi:hypothetical protein